MVEPVSIFETETQQLQQPSVVVGSVSARPSLPALAENAQPKGFTDLQWRFIGFYCAGVPAELSDTGEAVEPGDGMASALAAGYGGGAANMATRNLLKPHVQAEIESRVKAGRGTILLKAMTRALRIVEKSDDDRAVVAMIVALMDRNGMAAPKGGPMVQVNTFNGGSEVANKVLQEVIDQRMRRIEAKPKPNSPTLQVE